MQDPGSVQKVVHQAVDRDHAGAGLAPVIMAGRRRRNPPRLIFGEQLGSLASGPVLPR
jgi:hypothetical protein